MNVRQSGFFDSGVAMEQLIKFVNGIDPQGGGLALLWFALLGFSGFFVLKVWPWLTTVYFPAKIKEREMQLSAEIAREDKNTTALGIMQSTMAELKTLLHQLNDNLQRQNQWLMTTFMRPDENPLDREGK